MEINPVLSPAARWESSSIGEYIQIKNEETTVYRLGSFLGKGMNAVVFSLIPTDTSKKIQAVKIITNDIDGFGQKKDIRKQYEIGCKFVKEVGLQRSPKAFFLTEHPLPVRLGNEIVIPLGMIVMPKYEGSLNDIIPTMSFAEQKSAILQIIHGVAAMHRQNIVHRDISLDNIFYRNEKGGLRCDLSDFDAAIESPENMEELKRKDISSLAGVIMGILTRDVTATESLWNPKYNISRELIGFLNKMGNSRDYESLTIEEVVKEIDRLISERKERKPKDPFYKISDKLAERIAPLREMGAAALEANNEDTAKYYHQEIENLLRKNKRSRKVV